MYFTKEEGIALIGKKIAIINYQLTAEIYIGCNQLLIAGYDYSKSIFILYYEKKNVEIEVSESWLYNHKKAIL